MIEFRELIELKNRTKISNFDEQYSILKKEITEIFEKNLDCTPLLISIVGSTSYGLELETSDLDVKSIYIQSLDSILSELRLGQAKPLKYKEQINNDKKIENGKIKNDSTFYEIGRFLDLLQSNNPNILELLSSEEDCIIYKHPLWDELVNILKNSNVLTKKCYYTFFNYASQQIKKATGLNKKINNPIDKQRKTPIDFSHVIFEDDSVMILRAFLEREKLDQRLCGLVKVPHAKDLYGLYYDIEASKSFSKYSDEIEKKEYHKNKLETGELMGFGYKGIIKENENNEEVSNEIRLSSVPKGEKRIAQIFYNKDGYMLYCKDYTAYWGDTGWLKMRNEERYNDNISSGQNFDGKNLSHCLRLLYMAREIADNKGIIVKRNEQQRDELLEVKKGKLLYIDIMKKCEELTNGLEDDYKNSNLPDDIHPDTLSKILYDFRNKLYFK